MLSTRQAAEMLGVTERRVTALIRAGELPAEKFGRAWAIDEMAVEERMARPRLAGRPLAGEKNMDNLQEYTLYNKNHPVFDFVYGKRDGRIFRIGDRYETGYAPIGATRSNGAPSLSNLNGWFLRRCIPDGRDSLAATLRLLHCDQPADLLFGSLGLNLSDQYWFCPKGMELDWHDVNFFENPYVDRMGLYSAGRIWDLCEDDRRAPSAATPGMLRKWWEKREDGDYLLKAGSDGENREPFNERLCSLLYARLLDKGDYVPYSLEFIDGTGYSACKGFVDPGTELVTMSDMMNHGSPNALADYHAYIGMCQKQGVSDVERQLAKMLVCDFLTGNIDRHDQNLGLIQDAETREFLGVAPIFDSGMSFYFLMKNPAELEGGLCHYESFPFMKSPMRQLLLVSDYSWFEPERLEGFSDDIREVLSENRSLSPALVEATASQFSRRVECVREVAADFDPRFRIQMREASLDTVERDMQASKKELESLSEGRESLAVGRDEL